MEFTPAQIDKRIQDDPEMQELAQNDETEFLARHEQIYKEFGYHPDGSPIPAAKHNIGKLSRKLGIPEGVGEAVAAAPLAIAGTIAGTVAGSRGGPAGAVVGASGGSILGEAANSLLGITEPMTPVDMGIAGAAPLAGLGVSKAGPAAISMLKRVVPGAGAGMNELAAEQFAKQLGSMRVTKEHVQQARDAISMVPNFKVPIGNLKKLFSEESGSMARQASKGVPGSEPYLKDLNRVIAENPELGPMVKDSMSFKDLMTLEEGFNRIKSDRPGELWAKASGLIIEEMETALKNPKLTQATKDKTAQGLDAFKKFIQTNRKYHADETLVKAFTPDATGGIVKTVAGDTNLVLFDQKAFKKFLNNNETLNKAFSPAEIQSMRESVTDLGYISKPPSGGGDAVNLAKRYGVGGMIGWMTAGPMGAFAGAGVEELIRKAVTTETGRRVVKNLAKKGRGKIDGLELQNVLGRVVSGASAGVVPGVTGVGSQPESTQVFANQE